MNPPPPNSDDGTVAVLPPMQFPPEQIRCAEDGANRDAEQVAAFLSGFGFTAEDGPLELPEEFLVELAAAVRLLSWELQGFDVHRKAGLPSADDAIIAVFLRHLKAEAPDAHFAPPKVVLGLMLDRFAWTGPAELDGEVLLDQPDVDSWADDLATLLWNLRHERPTVDATT